MTRLPFRIDHLVDAICAVPAGHPEIRHDDATAFMQRELLNVRKQAILVERPELRGLFFVPAAEQADIGATHSTFQFENFVGEANLGSTMSTRPNRVDIDRQEATPIPYRHIEDAYGWSIKEIRSAFMVGRPLSVSKALAAQKVIAIKHDDIILIGDGSAAYLGLTGIFKLSGTLTYVLPVGGQSGTKVWEDKSGREIFNDAMAILNLVRTNSNGVEVPNMLALPLSSLTVAASKPWGIDSQETALDRIMKVAEKIYPGLMIEACEKLETAGSGSTKRACAYVRDGAKVYRDDLILFEQAAPIVEGWQTQINCHAETAGVRAPKPKSLCYADGL